MAQRAPDLITRLADRGEEAIQRLASAPGGQRLLDTLNGMRDRVDELQKRVRGIDALEKRVERLEKRVDELVKASKPARSGAARGTSTRSASASKPRPKAS